MSCAPLIKMTPAHHFIIEIPAIRTSQESPSPLLQEAVKGIIVCLRLQ